MIISLLGYMGCGKSHISRLLSENLNFPLVDLDKEIMLRNELSIPEIFKNKGEIFFRKQEKEVLNDILNSEKDLVFSLGGGTPAYFDNIETIKQKSICIYLSASVMTLFERLKKQKAKRPLITNISDEDLPEFIAKHLFERIPYYSQSQHTIYTDNKTPEEVVTEITRLLPPRR